MRRGATFCRAKPRILPLLGLEKAAASFAFNTAFHNSSL
jgi:hypothetical protein